MPKRRKCSPEFKRDTVQLTLAEGVEISQLAQNWESEPIFRAIDAVNSLKMGPKHFPARAIPRRRNVPSQARIFSIEKETGFFAKSGDVLHKRVEVELHMIERCCEAFPVHLMCRYLGALSNGYYESRDRPLSNRSKSNERFLLRIKAVRGKCDGVLGVPLIWEELRYAVVPAAKLVWLDSCNLTAFTAPYKRNVGTRRHARNDPSTPRITCRTTSRLINPIPSGQLTLPT